MPKVSFLAPVSRVLDNTIVTVANSSINILTATLEGHGGSSAKEIFPHGHILMKEILFLVFA
jgi:hypothetical protein